MTANTQMIYSAAPKGEIVPGETIKKVDSEIDLKNVPEGGVVVKCLALSMDPYMRGRMRDPKVQSYAAAYEIGKPIQGFVVGEIVASSSSAHPVGSHLYGFYDFGLYSTLTKEELATRTKIIKNEKNLPWTTLVGAAGMSGQTAWYGFYSIGKPKKGETIFISAASGAVGQIAGQLAKREGLKVVGSAGSDEKVKYIKEELGFDVAFNYKTENTLEILTANPPDIYFDNVGGEVLDHVLATMNNFGRIIACGAVSQYNLSAEERYGLKNYIQVVGKQLTYQGFIISGKPLDDFFEQVPGLIAAGDLKVKEHVTKGLDDGQALLDMMRGTYQGKAVISLE